MLRSGEDYRKAIAADGRRVHIDGEMVADVTRHPAFAPAIDHAAALYDMARARPEESAYVDPETGDSVGRIWMRPKTRTELAERRATYRLWAEPNFGLFGRSPPHVATYLASFAAGAPLFEEAEGGFPDHVLGRYRHARDNDLYLTYSIVHPQVDRSRPAHQWADPHIAVGVVKERDDGIVLRGASMLATGAAIADEILVSVIHPLPPGDEDYAISVVVPVNTHGLRLICRRGYAAAQPGRFDYPLSTRFDETDAVLVFDDVVVPWERVLVYRNRDLCRGQFYGTPGQVWANSFAQVRSLVKLQFTLGLAKRIAEMNGVDRLQPVREQLGVLAAHVATVEAMLLAAEYQATTDRWGNAVPDRRFLYGIMALHPEIHTTVVGIVRDLAGAGFLQVPSSAADFGDTVIGGDIERYLQSAGTSARDRVKLFKLAWDMIGSEFAGRQQQYELFFGGPPFLARLLSHDNYGYDTPEQLVEACLAEYGLDGAEKGRSR